MLSGERTFIEGMRAMNDGVTDEKVRNALTAHIEQTQGQVKNLEKTFDMMNAEPMQMENVVAKGLVESYRTNTRNIKDGKLMNVATLAAVDRVEHYEIGAYRGLITTAEKLGNQDVVKLLRENLQQEEKTAQKVESMHKEMQ